MMQTHEDSDFSRNERNRISDQFMTRLQDRADECVSEKRSTITAGSEGEEVLNEWKACGVSVKQLPPDEQGILRISIGGLDGQFRYVVFRGNHSKCVDLLRKALAAMTSEPDKN